MPKILTKDNPERAADYNVPTEEDKRKVFTWNDGEITIDSQVHIYDEIPADEKAEQLLAEVGEWFRQTEEYKANQADFNDFYNDKQLFRFCRARQFHLEKTKTLIMENVKWRLEQTPHLLKFRGQLEFHASCGKTLLRDQRDHWGRPVIVIHNHYNNSLEYDVGAQLTFYTLEKSSRWMNETPEGPSHHVVLLNMEHFSYSNQPPMDIAKKVGYALSAGYPERLGNVVIYNAPFLFRAFWATISGLLLDDRTKSKVVFVKEGDKQLDEKMNFIFGPNWHELTGIGDFEQPDPKVAPGFDPVAYAAWCMADDDARFGVEAATPEAAEPVIADGAKVEGEKAVDGEKKTEAVTVVADEEPKA